MRGAAHLGEQGGKTTGAVIYHDLVGDQACTNGVKHTQIAMDSTGTEVHACWTRDINSDDAFCNQRAVGTAAWSPASIVS